MIYDITNLMKRYIVIGEIDFSDNLEDTINESSIASNDSDKPNLRGIGLCNVLIGTDEGPVPHIHIKSKNIKWGSCICLHEAYYFPHGGNPLTEGVFNSKQAKDFDNWMKSKSPKDPSISNYLYCTGSWLAQYQDKYRYIYDKNHTNFTIKPDYTKMLCDFNENLR